MTSSQLYRTQMFKLIMTIMYHFCKLIARFIIFGNNKK